MEFLNKYFGFIVYLLFTMMFFWKFDLIFNRILNSIKKVKIKGFYLNVLIVAFVFFVFLFLLFFNSSMSDIPTHMRFAKDLFNSSNPTGHFLYFLLVKVFGFFSTNENVLILSSVSILSISVWLKYYVSSSICKDAFIQSKYFTKEKNGIIFLMMIGLLFFLPIITYPSTNRLLSVFSFNVWHNSTTIFLMPFALALFYLSYKFFMGYRYRNDIAVLMLLVAVNIFSKPSYFFVFAIVFPFFSLIKFKLNKVFWISIIPVFFGFILLLFQYLLIYKINNSNDSSVAISFFYSFNSGEKVIFYLTNVLKSYFFPIVFLLLNIRILFKKELYVYSLLSFVAAILIYFNITELGPRAGHGNFAWQIVVCGYIWFLVSIYYFLEKIFKEKEINYTSKFVLWSIGLHFMSFAVWLKYYVELKLW
ncbi:MAG: hypothetical protein PHI36_06060 [Bacteroidales bacterium]|nr:hypothetical protein [Bacteroidales bacterium]